MKKLVFTIAYCVLMVICFYFIDQKYGNLPPRSWFALFIASFILGGIGRRLDRWLVNSYLFSGVLILVLLICFDGLYELLFQLA